jgi:predicted AAA+ superfamily ATPase
VLPPFFVNIPKRLVKSPKVYLGDTGILHTLLGVRNPEDLRGSPHVGASWETYAVNQILPALPQGLEAFFYRTSDGTECDLVLARGVQPVACIEIKYSNNPAVSKGLRNTIRTLGTRRNFVLTYSSESYGLEEGIGVMGLREFVVGMKEHLAEKNRME